VPIFRRWARSAISFRSAVSSGMSRKGEKASGVGRFGGQWAIDEFTTEHWVSVQHRPREYAI
jgi:acyl-CoA reductase-like NAD-dependent aldehyde dehydrogenase